jgi:4-hydroxythreonine-4-phosphate dehydrogenase
MKKKILILSGDPNSINSEIIFKTWKKINNNLRKRIFIISNYKLLKSQFEKLGLKCKLEKFDNLKNLSKNSNLKIIDISLNFRDPFKVSHIEASRYTIDSLNLGHKMALRDDVSGLINCAISKNLLGKKKIGVTEFLADKCKITNNSEVMLIKNKKFAVSPITTHIDIADVSKKLEIKLIVKKVNLINKWFKDRYKKKPKIGMLGLNPHNAELRIDSQESKIIKPAISKLKKFKINIKGPLVADTVFIKDYKKYDVIIGMYHDQVLIPFKALFKFDAINITLGLNYLRTSPDHGVAVDLIGKNKADELSLLRCINFVDKFGK